MLRNASMLPDISKYILKYSSKWASAIISVKSPKNESLRWKVQKSFFSRQSTQTNYICVSTSSWHKNCIWTLASEVTVRCPIHCTMRETYGHMSKNNAIYKLSKFQRACHIELEPVAIQKKMNWLRSVEIMNKYV